MKLYIFFRMKSEYTSNAINMKKIFRKVSILVIHLLSQMKVYIFFRLQSETLNITIIMPNWHWKCFIYGLPLFSQMKIKIYFRTKNQTTSIAINWFYKFFFSLLSPKCMTKKMSLFYDSEIVYQCDKIWSKEFEDYTDVSFFSILIYFYKR